MPYLEAAVALVTAELLLKTGALERIGKRFFGPRRIAGLSAVAVLVIASILPGRLPVMRVGLDTIVSGIGVLLLLVYLCAEWFGPRERPVQVMASRLLGEAFGRLPLCGGWRHVGAFLLTLTTVSVVTGLLSIAIGELS